MLYKRNIYITKIDTKTKHDHGYMYTITTQHFHYFTISFFFNVPDEDNYELSQRLYQSEERYGDDDFIYRLSQGDIQIYKESLWWQKRYGLNEKELGEGIGEMLNGTIDITKEGLNQEQQKAVRKKLQKSLALPLDKLIDNIKYSD